MMKNSVLFLLLICLFSIECLRIGKSSAVLHRFILLSRNSLPTSQRKGTSLHSSNVIISPFDESHASGDDKVQ